MDDLISRQAVLSYIDRITHQGTGKQKSFEFIRKYVEKMPSAQPTVVRCKDCKHLVRSEGVCKVLSNNYEPPVYVGDDDFCSHGERRTDG